MSNKLYWVLVVFQAFSSFLAYGQKPKVVSGPMLGYVEKTEAVLWVQLNASAKVEWVFTPSGRSDSALKFGPVVTIDSDSFVAKVKAFGLKPGKSYDAHLLIDGKKTNVKETLINLKTQSLWEWRTDPPLIKIALGSCAYINEPAFDRPGKPYGGDYKIFNSIADLAPDLMLWLGDNIYLREIDWNTTSGMIHRYSHTRRTPEMQNLLKACAHYAAWDDHDFGPNDADRSWYLKRKSKALFETFWANPNTDVAEDGGVSSTFIYGDVQVFLLDNRYNRAPNAYPDSTKDYLGQKQIKWLLEALTASRASFKLIVNGGQVLNPAKVHENFANYSGERNQLIKELNRLKIKNVVFLTGDRHHTELSKLVLPNITLWDLTCSPLTSGTHAATNEGNYLQEPQTLISEQNFGMLTLSGPLKNRELKMSIHNVGGQLLWEKTLKKE